jgi:hypothetical protein
MVRSIGTARHFDVIFWAFQPSVHGYMFQLSDCCSCWSECNGRLYEVINFVVGLVMCEREALTGKVSRCSQLMQRLIKLMPDRRIIM